MDLSDKVIIITGAGSGIGAATARRLAKDHATLALADLNPDPVQKIKQEFPDEKIDVYRADVTKFDDLKHVADQTVSKYGRIDVIYCNAGVMLMSPLTDLKVKEWQATFNINVMGVMNGIGAVLPTMVKQKSGHVIATCSVAGHVPGPDSAAYNGSKFAVRAIMDSLRQEQAKNNIKTTIISPGSTATNLTTHISNKRDRKFADEFTKKVNGLRPEQIARTVEFAIATGPNMNVSEVIVRPIGQTV